MDFSQQSSTHTYSQEDVREILDIAMADRSTLDPDLSHPQLLEIAQELSISPDSLAKPTGGNRACQKSVAQSAANS
jgi:hypothetical protein